jgi:predicted small metal-binding protein
MINIVKPRLGVIVTVFISLLFCLSKLDISPSINDYSMTLSLNCKDAGDPVCTHTMTGETEEELLANAKKHGMEVHGYSEEKWNEDITKNKDHFRSLIKKV